MKDLAREIELDSFLVFNSAALEEYSDIRNENGKLMIESLVQDYMDRIDQIQRSIVRLLESRNQEELERVYHSLKSSSALIGLERIYRLAGILEDASAEGKLDVCRSFSLGLSHEFRLATQTLIEFLSQKK